MHKTASWRILGAGLAVALTVSAPASAQSGGDALPEGEADPTVRLSAQDQRGPVSLRIDGLYVYQGDADFDGGGSFKAQRSFLRAGAFYNFSRTNAVGLSVSYGQFDYDFSNSGAPGGIWNDITDFSVSVPIRFQASPTASVFLSPSVRYDYEDGANSSDGRTYGVFGGAAWRVSDSLTIGPALGIFTQIEKDDPRIFPAILVDWDISERVNLSTGTGLGATQGPGLTLSYKSSEKLRFGLTGRYENVRFRLNDQGLAPNGVGQDRSVPVVVSVDYEPFPGSSLSAFAGAEFNGELRLDDPNGNRVATRSYDPAPLVGAAFRFAF